MAQYEIEITSILPSLSLGYANAFGLMDQAELVTVYADDDIELFVICIIF